MVSRDIQWRFLAQVLEVLDSCLEIQGPQILFDVSRSAKPTVNFRDCVAVSAQRRTEGTQFHQRSVMDVDLVQVKSDVEGQVSSRWCVVEVWRGESARVSSSSDHN
ncbi:hypothetical protein AVEN_165201-1 [Araneus ventricosus]|uniref:Uncharacterized protein n=1 Tax=Araneus ventricosus TaxID=182803 RepID=A0A4Y2B875_ARAVE|nr:hypothetical protein AVEN_165201-1 [Araneus ventricosus]